MRSQEELAALKETFQTLLKARMEQERKDAANAHLPLAQRNNKIWIAFVGAKARHGLLEHACPPFLHGQIQEQTMIPKVATIYDLAIAVAKKTMDVQTATVQALAQAKSLSTGNEEAAMPEDVRNALLAFQIAVQTVKP